MKRTLTVSTIALMIAGLTGSAQAQSTGIDTAEDPLLQPPELAVDAEGTGADQTAAPPPPPMPTAERAQDAAGPVDLAQGQVLLGAKVHDRTGDKVGTVRNIVLGPDGSQLIVVEVGGFLGFFTRDVAFTPNQLSASADGSLRTQLTEADIDAMPEYKAGS